MNSVLLAGGIYAALIVAAWIILLLKAGLQAVIRRVRPFAMGFKQAILLACLVYMIVVLVAVGCLAAATCVALRRSF